MATQKSIEITCQFERETKNTAKYREQFDGDRGIVGSVYIHKPDYEKLGKPELINVTIAAA